MNTPKKLQLAPTPVRMDGELKDWLKGEAAKNRRSLNSEVIVRLEASRQADARAQKAKGPNRANG